jgi:hypothetical protein
MLYVRRLSREVNMIYDKERYRTDPHYRQGMLDRAQRSNKKRYTENPAYRAKVLKWNRASTKRRRATPEGFVLSEIRRIRHRCKEKGLPFDLEIADIIVPTTCPVLGIPITLGASPRSPGLPSIDRVVPSKGYVKGNVFVISWRANNLKHDCTDGSELRRVADYIDAHKGTD